jgi:hypothetical protein
VYVSGIVKLNSNKTTTDSSPLLAGNVDARVLLFGDQLDYTCHDGGRPSNFNGMVMENNLVEGEVQRLVSDVSVGIPERVSSLYVGTGKHSFRNLLIYQSTGGGALTSLLNANCFGQTAMTLPASTNSAWYFAVDVDDSATGDKFRNYGLWVEVQAAATYSAGNIVAEYWDGTAWRPFEVMSFSITRGFSSDAVQPFIRTGTHAINFDPRIQVSRLAHPEQDAVTYGAWAKNDPIASGTPLYWSRFRVASPLVASPTVSYFAFTGDATHQSHVFGQTMYFGNARKYHRTEALSAGFMVDDNPNDTEDERLYHSNMEIRFRFNRFRGGAMRTLYLQILLPPDIDTSAELRITMYYITEDGSTTGGVANWFFRWASAQIGDVVALSSGDAVTNPNERTAFMRRTVVAPERLGAHVFYLKVPEYIPPGDVNAGASLWLNIERRANAVEDTVKGDITISGIVVESLSRLDGITFY